MQKAQDYGTSWRILRLPSVTDQILIKGERIRSIQEKKVNLVGDSLESDFIGIVNYCIIALMIHTLEIKHQKVDIDHLPSLNDFYDQIAGEAEALMQKKKSRLWGSMEKNASNFYYRPYSNENI